METPQDVNTPLQDFESVVELAAFTQERLDVIDDDVPDKDLFETAGYLDKASREVLLGREVGIAGIFQTYDYDSESYLGRSSKLVEGLVEGVSNGFTVKRIEDLQPDIFDEEQGEVFEKLRKKAMGNYLVCHMVTHKITKGLSPDSGEITTHEYQAVAPIVASEINIYGEIDPQLLNISKEDTDLLIRSTDKASRRSLSRMLEVIDTADTTLDAILKASPFAEKVINRNKVPVVRSMLRALAHINGSPLDECRYRFKEFPPVLINNNGSVEIAFLESKFIGEVFFDGISAENKFYIDGNGGVIIPKRPRLGIYVDAVAPISPYQNQMFSIPVNLIRPGSYQAV